MSKIVRVENGDYKISVRDWGTVTLDTGPSHGLTVLTGNAEVRGTTLNTTQSSFLIVPYATNVELAASASTVTIGGYVGTTTIRNNADIVGDLTVQGGDFTTTSASFNLLNSVALTVNAFGAATAISLGAVTGNTTVNNNLVVTGDLIVNGTTTTVNSTEMSVDDINITLGATFAPTDAAANTGGITLKGTTDKTLNWILTNTAWTSSENFDLVTGKTYKIDATDVLSSSGVLNVPTTVTAFSSGTTVNIGAATGTTDIKNNLNVTGSNITSSAASVNLITTNATTINAFSSADQVTVGKLGAIFEILSTVQFAGNINVGGDISIGGGDMTSTTTTFNLLNSVVTDLYMGGAATNIQMGAATGNTTVNNNLVVTGDAGINGGDLTTTATSFNLLNTNSTTVTAFGAATTVNIGAATGNTNVKNNLAVTGTVSLDGNSIVTTSATLAIANNNTTTVNAFGEATTVNIGATTGTTQVRNNAGVSGTLTVAGDIISSASSLNLVNTNVTTLHFAGAATSIGIGSATGNTTVNNNLVVTGDLTVNGTTTTVNSTVMSVDDINVILGDTASPTDAAANTGGITLKGTTDKTLSWVLANTAWTSSENFDLASGKTYKINATDVLSSTSVLNSPASVTAFQAATTLSLGATTGTSNIRNNLTVTGNASFNSVDYIKLPVGTTAERPNTLTQGQVRFNSTTSEFEGYNGIAWGPFGGSSFESVALSSTSPYVLDSFALSTYRTAKYTIQMQNIVSTQLIEILVVHNDLQATYEVIKDTVLGGDCAVISVQISGSNLQVILTPVFDSTEIQFTKTRIISTSPVVGTLSFMPTNDLQNSSYAIDLSAYVASTIDLNV